MTATLPYRIATLVLVLFAAGHTVGFLKFKPLNAEGIAVYDAMNRVRIEGAGTDHANYGDFYRGLGLFCTAYLLFNAYFAWCLAGLAKSTPQAIGSLGWAFFVLQLVSIAISWKYLLPPPTIFSAVLAILTGWSAWLVSAAKP